MLANAVISSISEIKDSLVSRPLKGGGLRSVQLTSMVVRSDGPPSQVITSSAPNRRRSKRTGNR